MFDPSSESYGHGNNKTGETKSSILHPDLKTIPSVPQVQLIGNGTVYNHEGLAEVCQPRYQQAPSAHPGLYSTS